MHRCPTLFFLSRFLTKTMIFILPETSLRKETAVAFFFRQPLFALTLQALWIGTYCSNDVKKWNKKKLDTSGRIEAANPNT